jgi:predicted flap endonuclease-1-like 5' DNA nuclease
MEWVTGHWTLALIVALAAILLLYLLLRPRQRVVLSDNRPVRPHMAVTHDREVPHHPVAGSIPFATVKDIPGASGPPDDLVMLKGIGPKLAALLNQHGLTRFDQIAMLSPGQVADLDDTLGAFRGRLSRDHVVEQADYLARGDTDGFQQRFGKL